MNIWWLVCLAVFIVLTCILVFRLHAFLTLLLAGLMVAAFTTSDAITGYTDDQVEQGEMTTAEATTLVKRSAPGRLVDAFGTTAGKIGILIALASIIGQCLLESGAASTIVDRMLKLTGPRRAPEALAASSFVLGIPVFFDTVFYLMIPLARSLRRSLGKNYVLYILAILAGGSIAHSLVPPTPGPLWVATELKVDIGTMMVAGLVIGGCSSFVSLIAARVINHYVDVPLRFEDESPSQTENQTEPHSFPGLGEDADTDETRDGMTPLAQGRSRPPLFLSLIPILMPVLLITVGSVVAYLGKPDADGQAPTWAENPSILVLIVRGLGDKNIALGVGVVLAMTLTRYCDPVKRKSLVTRSLASAGNIILITAAGGAFGAMLRQADIGSAVGTLTQSVPGIMILPVAFAVTAAIRTLQGSATVAMITAAGILQTLATAESLPFHPVYLAMAIGAGSKPVSWMTDSAFWVIIRMSGMTESEGLRVISPMSISMGISALLFTILFASIYPGI